MADRNIRLLKTPEEMTAVEELQAEIWSGSQADIVPAHMLLAAVHNGGLVLGAFNENRLIGMLFGFPGLTPGEGGMQPKHCSHMLGIHPEWRDTGLGFALKCVQRDHVLKQGLKLVTWTFDPLLSRNAYLNISRLGAVCNTYLRSEYGQMRDGLNIGLESDRFQVDWWLDSARVETRLNGSDKKVASLDDHHHEDVELMAAGTEGQPLSGLPMLDRNRLLVEIPEDFLTIKADDFPLAKAWRSSSRAVFEKAFANGFIVTDFVHDGGRSFYVFSRQTDCS
jgi:predicted GNAT superfamily acetyltransferase